MIQVPKGMLNAGQIAKNVTRKTTKAKKTPKRGWIVFQGYKRGKSFFAWRGFAPGELRKASWRQKESPECRDISAEIGHLPQEVARLEEELIDSNRKRKSSEDIIKLLKTGLCVIIIIISKISCWEFVIFRDSCIIKNAVTEAIHNKELGDHRP